MCTLALINRDMVLTLGEKGLENIFESLRQSDGMGVACLREDGKILFDGGHDATPLDMADYIMTHSKDPISWYCFHSRQATTAPRMRDDLVQPFIDQEKGFAMGHVGTIVEIDKWSIDGVPVSDGRMVFELATKYSISPIWDLSRSRVGSCAGFYHGNAYWTGRGLFYCNPSTRQFLLTSRHVEIGRQYIQFELDGKPYIMAGHTDTEQGE